MNRNDFVVKPELRLQFKTRDEWRKFYRKYQPEEYHLAAAMAKEVERKMCWPEGGLQSYFAFRYVDRQTGKVIEGKSSLQSLTATAVYNNLSSLPTNRGKSVSWELPGRIK